MSELVVLNLGQGDFNQGFPSVTARLGQPGNLGMQMSGSLPPAPDIPQLYTNWRLLYQCLYRQGRRSPIEVAATGVTNISDGAFSEISQRLETRINGWLAAAGFQGIESQLRTQLSPSQGVQIIVESDNDQVWRLPWHLWTLVKQDFPNAEICLSSSNYPAPMTQRVKSAGSVVKLLVILGNSSGLNVKKDWRLLKQQLPGVTAKLLVEPEREELNDQLWQQGWDILVFAGHSVSDESAKNGRIFINQKSHNNSLTIYELQEALSQAIEQGLQLVIFNSCDGLGLVRDLADARIPLPPTIAMREPVVDAVAHAFLRYFLREFAAEEPLHLAVRQARERLKGLEDRFPGASWLPVICQHPAVKPLTLPELRGSGELPSRDRTPVSTPKFHSVRPALNERIKFTLILIVGCISSYVFAGAWIANSLDQLGVKNHKTGHLWQAQIYYRLATWLNPTYANPHYNLAYLCDKDLNDLNCAFQEYQRAARRGLPEGYAQMARLQVINDNHDSALSAIDHCIKQTDYNAVKAACLKNLGWILFKEENLSEAEKNLRQAIELEVDSPHSYCLLAQVLEAQGRENEALTAWDKTLEYSQHRVPEQHHCMNWANQRLETGEIDDEISTVYDN
ncbi:MAG: CHAT domain-containing protein [Coleofasciculus sp. C2-GNP5-27]